MKKPQAPSESPAVPIDDTDIKNLAEQYLDLWQENLRLWATDPRALDKWVNETAKLIKTSKE